MNIHRQRLQAGLELVNDGKQAEGRSMLSEGFVAALADGEPRWISLIGRNLALLYEKSGNVAKAVECLETVVREVPEDALSRYSLGRTYLLAGDREAASAALAECRRIAERGNFVALLELLDAGVDGR